MNNILRYIKSYANAEWITAVVLLLIGGFIYILYRPQNLLMFEVFDGLGLMPYIDSLRINLKLLPLSGFVVNSLPAGLWAASYLMMMYITTKCHTRKMRLMLALPLPISAIVLEFMQYFGWCPGTFDVYDIICYIVPLFIFVKSIK